jgi:predicted DNA-binding transcriptional regulator AlpA
MPTATAPTALAIVPDHYLDSEQCAQLFHVSPATIRSWSQSGRLPRPVKIGRRLLFRAEEVWNRLRDAYAAVT